MGAPTFAFGGNEHLAEILDRISDGFVELDLDWRFTYINRAAEQYFGTPRDQMLGKVAWDLFPEGVGPTVAQEYLRAVAGTTPVEFEVLSPIKNNWVAHRIYPSGSGATIYFRDVSAERGAAEVLRESEQRFRSLYDHCLDGVLLTTPEGDILAANPGARRILQRSEEELCRLGRTAVVDADDPRLALLLEQRPARGIGARRDQHDPRRRHPRCRSPSRRRCSPIGTASRGPACRSSISPSANGPSRR